jgi:NitT/TauT family transport system ATP-binding protein
MASPKLETRGLSKRFRRGESVVPALRDIDLSVADGEFVSLVGASGCGKSTFLRLVDGLTPPTSGEVRLDGVRVDGPGPDRAFVFQEDRMLPWRTVRRNVAIGLELKGVPKRDAAATADRLLDLVGIPGFANHYPRELSGGMRQRANIARALAIDPDVLLMDEPFASLDGQTREIMQAELLRVWDESRKTVLFVTHQIDEAVYLSDRVVVLTVRPGRVKADIPIDLPRPRTLAMKRSAEFGAYVDQVWGLIEEEVKEAMGQEMRAATPST